MPAITRTLAALAAAALIAVPLAACEYEEGPPGRVVDKHRSYSCTGTAKNRTCDTKYALTVQTKTGDKDKFRVGRSDYGDCRRGSAYPGCTDR